MWPRPTSLRNALQRAVLIGGITLLASACSSETTSPTTTADLTLSANTTVQTTPNWSLQVGVTVTNGGATSITLPGPSCSIVNFSLYQDTSSASPAVWTNPPLVCLLILTAPVTLEPGHSYTYTTEYTNVSPELTVDPPANGTYFVRATINLPNLTRTVNAGTVAITL